MEFVWILLQGLVPREEGRRGALALVARRYSLSMSIDQW
jgi:hypothetical protein